MASLKFASRIVAPGLSVFTLACLGPNPLLDGSETDTVDESSSDGDGDPSTGDGDGDPSTGDGDGDGEPASCSNDVLDGDETDLDCGGSCGPCDDGSTCAEQTDCASQVCAGTMCQAPSCDDDVQNGDEIGIDCGGAACGFCEYSSFATELDDFEGSAASIPRVAMFDDGSFALTYNGPMEARARWFDEFGAPLGPSIEVSEDVEFVSDLPIPIAPGQGDDHPIHVLEAGVNQMNKDLNLVRLTAAGQDTIFTVLANHSVAMGDLTVDGNTATISWEYNDNILTRRFSYDSGMWTDIMPFNADDQADTFDGSDVAADRNADGLGVVAWFHTADGGAFPWTTAVRRFDAGWVDAAPITTADTFGMYTPAEPRVAIADDGRVAVVMRLYDLEKSHIGAWILDANLVPEGPPWVLQTDLPHDPGLPAPDVQALSDGSFAFVWPDPGQNRVHLRRFVGPNVPKLNEVGDESPWPVIEQPAHTSLAGIDGRLVVVWSAMVDGVRQIQGQVLSY